MRALPNNATSFDISRELHPGALHPNTLDETSLTIIKVGNIATRRLTQWMGNQHPEAAVASANSLDNPALSVVYDDEIGAAAAWHMHEVRSNGESAAHALPSLYNKVTQDIWTDLGRITHSYGHHAYPIDPMTFNKVALREGEDGSVNLMLQPERKSQDPAVVAIREERRNFLNALHKMTGYVPSGVEKSDIGYHIGSLSPETPPKTRDEIRSMLGCIVSLELFQSNLRPTAVLTSRSTVNAGFKMFDFSVKPNIHHSADTAAGKEAIMRALVAKPAIDPAERTVVKGADVPKKDYVYHATMRTALEAHLKQQEAAEPQSPEALAEQVAWMQRYQAPDAPDVPTQRETSPTVDSTVVIGNTFHYYSGITF